jgi:hypothetical protein
MSTFEADVRTLILRPAVVDLIVDRVIWEELPGATVRPCVCVWYITGEGGYTMDGPSGLNQTMIQIDVWGDTFPAARAVRDAIQDGIDAYRGVIGSTDIQGVFFRGIRGGNEPSDGAPAQRYSRQSLDAEIWHARTS